MNEFGLQICLSHVGIKSTFEVMELSKDPVVFSHGNVRALCDHPRNLTDEQIDALAATDGMIGVGAWCSLVSTDPEKVTLDHFMKHIDYLVDRIGSHRVGLGIDLAEGLPVSSRPMSTEAKLRVLIGTYELGKHPPDHRYPPELDAVRKRPQLGGYLSQHGFGEEEMRNILGGSFLRVFRQVWRN
jgi:membrane dipeptidase